MHLFLCREKYNLIKHCTFFHNVNTTSKQLLPCSFRMDPIMLDNATEPQIDPSKLTESRCGLLLMAVFLMVVPFFTELISNIYKNPVLLIHPVISFGCIVLVYWHMTRFIRHDFHHVFFCTLQLMLFFCFVLAYTIYYSFSIHRSELVFYIYIILIRINYALVVVINIVHAVSYDGKEVSFRKKYKIMQG